MKKGCRLILLLCLFLTLNIRINYAVSVKCGDSSTIKYGVNYLSTHCHYEPYYLSEEELERDFGLFRKQGLEYVTIIAVWKYLEPSLGVYNDEALNDLKRVCAFAAKYKLKVIIDFYTMMQEDTFTMPTWLSPRKFETVFTNETARRAWLNFLNHAAYRLNDSEGIWSWHMMNEPGRQAWACNVSIEDFLQLWTEMRAIFKSYSERPVSIRFAAQVFDSPLHFNRDPRIYSICDYVALNWYEDHCSPELLVDIVMEIRQHTRVIISEFGYNTDDDALQADKYQQYIQLFKSIGLQDCIAWLWRADHPIGNPELPGTRFNLAKNAEGEPRPAFYLIGTVPPAISAPTPTPAPTPVPAPTPTPQPTATPGPTSESTPPIGTYVIAGIVIAIITAIAAYALKRRSK